MGGHSQSCYFSTKRQTCSSTSRAYSLSLAIFQQDWGFGTLRAFYYPISLSLAIFQLHISPVTCRALPSQSCYFSTSCPSHSTIPLVRSQSCYFSTFPQIPPPEFTTLSLAIFQLREAYQCSQVSVSASGASQSCYFSTGSTGSTGSPVSTLSLAIFQPTDGLVHFKGFPYSQSCYFSTSIRHRVLTHFALLVLLFFN